MNKWSAAHGAEVRWGARMREWGCSGFEGGSGRAGAGVSTFSSAEVEAPLSRASSSSNVSISTLSRSSLSFSAASAAANRACHEAKSTRKHTDTAQIALVNQSTGGAMQRAWPGRARRFWRAGERGEFTSADFSTSRADEAAGASIAVGGAIVEAIAADHCGEGAPARSAASATEPRDAPTARLAAKPCDGVIPRGGVFICAALSAGRDAD